MTCVLCKNSETKAGFTTVVMERDDTVVVMKKVPADICTNCGEYYLDDRIAAEVLDRAENAVREGAEVEVVRCAA